VHDYSAGYYSYIWAEVLDKDAFNAFVETGLFNQTTARAFRTNILEKGGSVEEMQMYLNFRGKEPTIEPLLKGRGLQ
jgi:peptidyl-dipeptidase Dcp